MDGELKIIIKKVPDSKLFGDLDSRLKKINSNGVGLIVFKVSIDIVSHLEGDAKDREQVVNRAGDDVPVYLLTLHDNFSGYSIYHVTNDACVDVTDDDILNQIRHADFIDVLEKSDGECFHIAEDGMHYLTPSGMHTKAFLRLADAVHSFGRLDRISYWLLPSINEADAVLFDNWSLSSIVLHSQSILGRKVKFDCLHQHVNFNAEDARKVAEGLLGELEPGNTVLILVSVNASGGHVTSLIDMCKKIRPDLNFSSASIYQMPCDKKFAPTDMTFCELQSPDMTSYLEESCPHCEDGEKIIHIDERYYYPKQSKENPVSLPSKYVDVNSDIKQHLDLIGKVEGAFCVHRDDPNDEETPRHHAFYVDVKKLMNDDGFLDAFGRKMSQIKEGQGVPDVIVCPPHDAAKAMVKAVSDIWECPVVETHTLRDLSDEQASLLRKSTHICILDDVIVTGGRIDRYVRSIREDLRPNKDVFKKLSVLVAVERAIDQSSIKKLKDGSLSQKNEWQSELYSVTKVYLPNWGKKECPWCKEADMWGEVAPPFDEPDYYKSRMNALNSNVTSGIAFCAIPNFKPDQIVTLGARSPLADEGSSEMHSLFVVAVALQRMRFDPEGKQRLARTFVNNNALDVTNTTLPCGEETSVLKRYSEPLIQACLLRCANPSEWSSDMLKIGIPELISNVKDGDGSHILLLEIMFYLKRRSYSSEFTDQLEDLFREYVSDLDDPSIALLETMRV